MKASIDTLLSLPSGTNDAARARALAAVRAELSRNPPVRRWRSQASWVFAATALLTAAVLTVMLVLGAASVSRVLGRAPLLGLLWGTSAVCAWGSLSPRGRRWQLAGLALAGISAGALVLARLPVQAEPTLPGWVCTASHVGVGLVPLVVALVMLRSTAFRPLRALTAGLSAGTAGAFVGELACSQGWRHVAVYHLSAWVLISLAALAVSWFLPPRSFAP